MPVLTGSLVRVPLGIWTDRFGGRIVMAALLAITVPAIWAISFATQFWHFLAIGLVLGLAGRVFGGYARTWPAGSPKSARAWPWVCLGPATGRGGEQVCRAGDPGGLWLEGRAQVYAAIMLGTLVLFWLLSHSDPRHLVPSHVKFSDQLKLLKDPRVLKYCQYYSIVFGGYVALGAVDGAVLRGRIRAGHPRGRAARVVLSRCPAVCCGPSAGCCQTNTVPTASPGG